MDEINCPLCGKPNPVENKYCEYCLGFLERQESDSSGSELSDREENRDGLGGHSSEDVQPEWLTNFQDSGSSEKEPQEDGGLGLSSWPAADTSDWMPGSSKEDPSTRDERVPISPFVGDSDSDESGEIPSWLDDALIEEGSPEDQEIEEPLEIPDGQLQKEERVDIQKVPGSLESAGPLAGLSGVLSAEPGVARIRKPGAYSTKIRVTESQQEHVELLQSLLEDEGKPKSAA